MCVPGWSPRSIIAYEWECLQVCKAHCDQRTQLEAEADGICSFWFMTLAMIQIFTGRYVLATISRRITVPALSHMHSNAFAESTRIQGLCSFHGRLKCR